MCHLTDHAILPKQLNCDSQRNLLTQNLPSSQAFWTVPLRPGQHLSGVRLNPVILEDPEIHHRRSPSYVPDC